MKKLTLEEIQHQTFLEGHQLLSQEYKNNKSKLAFTCPAGHLYTAAWCDFQAKKRCRLCGIKKAHKGCKKSPEKISELLEKREYTRTAQEEYINNRTKIKLRCSKGHAFASDWLHLQAGHGCPSCFSLISKQHKEIAEYVRSLGVGCEDNVRNVIDGELDVYIPTKRLAIELDGLYWHSENRKPDIKSRNRAKLVSCRKHKVSLLVVYEDEWKSLAKRKIVQAMIRSRIGVFDRKLRASSLDLRTVAVKDRRNFFEASHIDGDVPSKSAFGLFFENKLVCCLSLRWNTKYGCLEIARFATLPGTTVHGGLGRLLKKVEGRLITYSNNRVGDGKAYAACGFALADKEEHQSYWYTDFKERVWRFRCRRVSEPSVLLLYPSESEQALNGVFSYLFKSKRRDVFKIWDYGHRLWVKN